MEVSAIFEESDFAAPESVVAALMVSAGALAASVDSPLLLQAVIAMVTARTVSNFFISLVLCRRRYTVFIYNPIFLNALTIIIHLPTSRYRYAILPSISKFPEL